MKFNAKSDETKRARREFSESEINLLWEYSNLDSVKIVLMLIYSGVRVSELLNLKISNVNLDEQTFFVESSKTDSGVRTVPIADKVLPFWQKFISDSQCGYVLNNTNGTARIRYVTTAIAIIYVYTLISILLLFS